MESVQEEKRIEANIKIEPQSLITIEEKNKDQLIEEIQNLKNKLKEQRIQRKKLKKTRVKLKESWLKLKEHRT